MIKQGVEGEREKGREEKREAGREGGGKNQLDLL